MPTLITLAARGPLLFPKESAPTDKAVTLHGPCGLTRSVGWRGGVCPRTGVQARRRQAAAPAGRAWSPQAGQAAGLQAQMAPPMERSQGAWGPCPARACRPRLAPGESVPIREWAVWPPVFSLSASSPYAQLEGEGWKAG